MRMEPKVKSSKRMAHLFANYTLRSAGLTWRAAGRHDLRILQPRFWRDTSPHGWPSQSAYRKSRLMRCASTDHLGEAGVVYGRVDLEADYVAPLLRPLGNQMGIVRLVDSHSASTHHRVPSSDHLHPLRGRSAGLLKPLLSDITVFRSDPVFTHEKHGPSLEGIIRNFHYGVRLDRKHTADRPRMQPPGGVSSIWSLQRGPLQSCERFAVSGLSRSDIGRHILRRRASLHCTFEHTTTWRTKSGADRRSGRIRDYLSKLV